MIINAMTAITALTAITAQRPDFIYNRGGAHSCFYERGGYPSCGVGRALAYLGMNVEQLHGLDECPGGVGILRVSLPHGWYATKYARAVFAAFQEAQDTGNTWGQALDSARREFA